jgi:hypothetical protein
MPAVDMQLINEAIARRAQGLGMPMGDQMSLPNESLPTGGPNTPAVPPSQTMPQGGANLPQRQVAMKAGQTAQSPMFDQDTRETAKILIAKLLKAV